jgi:hypothetical protein
MSAKWYAPVSAHSLFAVELEPATINRFGSELVNWVSSDVEQAFLYSPPNSDGNGRLPVRATWLNAEMAGE